MEFLAGELAFYGRDIGDLYNLRLHRSRLSWLYGMPLVTGTLLDPCAIHTLREEAQQSDAFPG